MVLASAAVRSKCAMKGCVPPPSVGLCLVSFGCLRSPATGAVCGRACSRVTPPRQTGTEPAPSCVCGPNGHIAEWACVRRLRHEAAVHSSAEPPRLSGHLAPADWSSAGRNSQLREMMQSPLGDSTKNCETDDMAAAWRRRRPAGVHAVGRRLVRTRCWRPKLCAPFGVEPGLSGSQTQSEPKEDKARNPCTQGVVRRRAALEHGARVYRAVSVRPTASCNGQ